MKLQNFIEEMKLRNVLFLLLVVVEVVVGPPVNPGKPASENEVNDDDPQGIFTLEYARYLREVVEALEQDPDFKKKLQNSTEDEIKSGAIAKHLEFVNHNIRSKLDEIKRNEYERVRRLVREHDESLHGIDRKYAKIPRHFDHRNPYSFEQKDLENLIAQATRDIDEADKRRRTEFKEYEMEKERARQEKLKVMDEEHRKKAEREHEEELKKHKEHPKLHHPGTKDQFEEVWEKEDHLPVEEFNPKTFFRMHDINGDGYWDPEEMKALFVNELNKMYDANSTDFDINEKMEEMERMREHVYKESDLNRDGLISFKEFIDYTQRKEYNEDPGWQSLDEQPQFTKEEYEAYERQRREELARMAAQGINPWGDHPPVYGAQGGIPPGPVYNQGYPPQGYPQPGYQQGMHVPYQQPNQNFQQPPHPNQQPHYQQAPVQPGQQQQQHVPGQQQQPNVPVQQQQQQQQQPNAVPAQQQPGVVSAGQQQQQPAVQQVPPVTGTR